MNCKNSEGEKIELILGIFAPSINNRPKPGIGSRSSKTNPHPPIPDGEIQWLQLNFLNTSWFRYILTNVAYIQFNLYTMKPTQICT